MQLIMRMNQVPPLTKEELNQVFLTPFIDGLKHEVDKQKSLLSKTEQAYQSYYERIVRIESKNEISKFINETEWLKSTLYAILENEFPERREIHFSEEFEEFVESSDTFLNAQPELIEIEQSKNRFYSLPEDSFKLKLLKPLKRFCYNLSIVPTKTANLFRTNKKATPYWSQKIPYRAIATYYFGKRFANECLGFFEEMQQLKCQALNLVTDIDIDINREFNLFLENKEHDRARFIEQIEEFSKRKKVAELNEILDKKLEYWRDKSSKHLDLLLIEFNTCISLVDTIELNEQKFSGSNLTSEANQLLNKYNRIFNGWKNTFFAQIDDFQVDLELYHIKYRGLQQFQLLQKSCDARIKSTIENKIIAIEKVFDAIEENLSVKAEKNELKPYLEAEKFKLNRKLEKELIPQAIEALYNQNLPQLLDRLEFKIKGEIEKMNIKRIIYSKSKYNKPINKSELSHFNPRELVEIDIFPKFLKINAELKSKIINDLEDIKLKLNDLSGISDYNLVAAISSIDDNQSIEEVIRITHEGLLRAKSKTIEVREKLSQIEKTIYTTLQSAITEFNSKVISLTENENITQIRLKIAKAKAIERTDAYKKKVFENIKGFLPIAFRYIKSKANQLVSIVDDGLKKVGLKNEPQKLTAELSDYLAQTDKAIDKLPYVYKRLYQIKPLEEEIFFEGRETELKKLNAAYDSWKKGNYSSTCMHGEKGSGASSLVNLFQRELNGVEIYRFKFDKAYYREEDFFSFFKTLLNVDKVDCFDDVVQLLCNGKKKVIILEDLQHFYLKKIEGFTAINLLFELISISSENVFWLVEITSYTYKYLEKTIGIERYFRYNIELKELSNQQIINLIMKRHRVSGYNLEFEASDLTGLEIRKQKMKSPQEKQALLKELFFANLNQFAQSNISLALLFWLRSTKSVDGNTIVMSRIRSLNFNFLNTLSNDSIFTLHVLLLHNSLNVEEHALVFHQSETNSRRTLMVLVDHGLLKLSGDRYSINRLLYRQVVNVLINKNIIH
ncbi:MAG: hypothetical protein KDB74_00505 [Flavobacteriales bacterium]|nr:hypothetical protein [Flavobacteriales bacterium]